MNNRTLIVVFLCAFAGLLHTIQATTFPHYVVVSVPVADLVFDLKKSKIHRSLHSDNTCYRTQMLYGERLLALEEHGPWLHVQTLEQEGFYLGKGWQPCKGWIKKEQVALAKDLPVYNVVVKKLWAPIFKPSPEPSNMLFSVSLGTAFHAEQSSQNHSYLSVDLVNKQKGLIKKGDVYAYQQRQECKADSVEKLRSEVIQRAKQLLGTPYNRGGRSAFNPDFKNQTTGVTCSGLINLSFRAIGITIPRYAHDQYLKSYRVTGALQPGDLIFYAAKDKPKKIIHVMMYIGDGKLIEATNKGSGPHKVRILSVTERIGKSLHKIKYGQTIGAKTYYFGSFFKSHTSKKQHIQELEHSSKTLRHKIIASAKQFLNQPYRKSHEHNAVIKRKRQKVDCSELIQKAYRANNLTIPRNSHGQFIKCKKIKTDIAQHLKHGDLIFAASRKNPTKINHVMMYIGNDQLIESTGANGKVRIISLQNRIGTSISSFKYGRKNRNSIYYAGTLLA